MLESLRLNALSSIYQEEDALTVMLDDGQSVSALSDLRSQRSRRLRDNLSSAGNEILRNIIEENENEDSDSDGSVSREASSQS